MNFLGESQVEQACQPMRQASRVPAQSLESTDLCCHACHLYQREGQEKAEKSAACCLVWWHTPVGRPHPHREFEGLGLEKRL